MKKRSPIVVFALGLVTLGFYSWYWAVVTKGEMNKQGEKIPTAWIWLIPFVGALWWYWKYSEGVGHITKDKMSGILAFILLLFLSIIGQAIIQDSFNKVDGAPAPTPASTPVAPVATPPAAAAPTV
ncbi:MAG TPA: DUF4234 domain-containing protein [Patescibacteria group bacterium]|nr:DUF4234 domain-containing protein [Patescibacteria group bacterium]